MPSRNILKTDVALSYYHVYARGINRQQIFPEPGDYYHFQRLLARYLSRKQITSKTGEIYPNYNKRIELLAYCLMSNHFHLLVYQVEKGSMSRFMKSLMTSYSRYFNLKYKRTGPVFESRYKASRIDADNYLHHISRYIHLNPRYWKRYPYSSLQFYEKGDGPEWLLTDRILSLFETRRKYSEFVADYEDHKQILSELKHELANA